MRSLLAAVIHVKNVKKGLGIVSTERCRDRRYRLIYLDSSIAIPIKEDCKDRLTKYHGKIKLNIMDIPNIPPRKKRMASVYELEKKYSIRLPKSFNDIGDIILINEVPSKSDPYLRDIGEIFRNEYGARAVFIKENEVSGELRIAKWRLISGFGEPKTFFKENNLFFIVDFSKAFYNPRLGQERLRVYNKARETDLVIDLFTGVGPFAILLARKVKKVIGFDINCDAIALAKLNSEINNVKEKVDFICSDARKAPSLINEKFNRVIMNYPERSIEFLDTALKLVKEKGELHLYIFIRDQDKKQALSAAKERINEALNALKIVFSIDLIKNLGEVAPRKYLVVSDIVIGG